MSGSEHSSSIKTDLESVEVDSGNSSDKSTIPMEYSFEPIQVTLQRLPVMILTWVRLQSATMHLPHTIEAIMDPFTYLQS